MKLKSLLFFIALHSICFIQYSWSLQIISPTEGEEVTAGTDVTVIVKADAGENWKIVRVGFDIMTYDSVNNVYSKILPIPIEAIGPDGQLIVFAADEAGNSVELQRNVMIKLPREVNLQSIEVAPNLVFLYRMPINSDPNDIRIFETKNLSVGGKYSDGIERGLTSSARGTTYKSSDEQIITVSPDGIVTAQGIGEAQITVMNGNFRSMVDVVVKPYRTM